MKDKVVASSAQPPTRKNSGAATTMRKYQQLALAVVSVISLMAFLFYKHEYDRLRYTLQYLEMFGTSPIDPGGANSLCAGTATPRDMTTAPHVWLTLGDDIAVYSAFWDVGSSFTKPVMKTLAVVKQSNKLGDEVQSRIVFESGGDVNAVCSIEELKGRAHGTSSLKQSNAKLATLICEPENNVKMTPYLTQFRIGSNGVWSSQVLVQESETWRSVPNITCVCAYSSQASTTTLRLVEFISHHNALGVGKFVFFGPLLTPLSRKLLDKYGEEIGLYYEEKAFTLPRGFSLSDEEVKTLVEKDCLHRHRGRYENAVVLSVNEMVVPRTQNSLQEIMTLVGGGTSSAAIAEFHLVSQEVCVDEAHATKPSGLLLESQVRSLAVSREAGAAILRPHLLETGLANYRVGGVPTQQHLPSATISIYRFQVCQENQAHAEMDHLPTYARLGDVIRKSILYRKWKVSL